MHHSHSMGSFRSTLRVAAASVMLMLWIFAFLLAASPALHHWLHDDSHLPTHQCLATRLHQEPIAFGQVGLTLSVPTLPVLTVMTRAEATLPSDAPERFSPSRAPPSVLDSHPIES